MKPTLRTSLSVLTIIGSIFFAGCGDEVKEAASNVTSAAASVTSGASLESLTKSIAPYISPVANFNGNLVRMNFAYGPTLERMKNGEHLTSVSLPNYGNLEKALSSALSKGSSGFSDIDDAAKRLLEILKEIIPITENLESYYRSRGFDTDEHAQGSQLIQQYLPLQEKFTEAYNILDTAINKNNRDISDKLLAEMKSNGRINTANFIALQNLAEDIGDLLLSDTPDNASIEEKLQELSRLNGDFTPQIEGANASSIKSFKSQLDSFIGRTRAYLNSENGNLNAVIEQYNRMVDSGNRVDINALDKKK